MIKEIRLFLYVLTFFILSCKSQIIFSNKIECQFLPLLLKEHKNELREFFQTTQDTFIIYNSTGSYCDCENFSIEGKHFIYRKREELKELPKAKSIENNIEIYLFGTKDKSENNIESELKLKNKEILIQFMYLPSNGTVDCIFKIEANNKVKIRDIAFGAF